MNSEPQIIRRPAKWPIYLGIFVALVAVLYFVVTSGPFIRSFVLPRVESAIACKLEVGDLSLSPFSQLELRNVKVTPNGAEPLAQVDLIRLRYSLSALLGGKIQAHEVTVEKPVITLIELADGTRNLPKLPPSGPKSTAPIALDLHLIQLRNGQLTYTVRGPKGPLQTVTVTGLNLSVDQLVTGQSGKLSINGQAGIDRVPADKVVGKINGEFAVTVGPDALPKLLKGSLALDLSEALGAFADAAGLGLTLESDVTETEIKNLGLAFRRNGQELGRLRLAGPYDLAKSEARLDYELSGLDRRVLVLVGGSIGVDIGETSAAAKGKINLLKNGQVMASDGEVTLSKLSLGLPAGRTPVTGFRTQYKVEVNLTDSAALLETLQLSATDAAGEWFTGTLDRPMNVAWGKAATGFRPSQFAVKLSRFNLGDWRAVLGTNAPTGNLKADFVVTSEKDGHLLKFTLSGLADRLTAQMGANQLQDGALEFSGTGSLTDFNAFALSRLDFSLKQRGTPLVTGNALADWQTKTATGGAQINMEGELPPLLGLVPVAGVAVQSGKFKVNTQLNQKETSSLANLTLTVDKLTGQIQDTRLTDYQATVQLNAGLAANVLDLQRFNLTAGNAILPGGTVDAAGRWDLTKRTGNFEYHITGLNQSALEPWLAGALKPNRLQSVKIDATGKAQVDLSAESAITTDLKIAGLRAQNPAGETIGPLDIGFVLDAAGRQTGMDVRKAILQLGATTRAKNELTLSGRLDLATNKPAPSTLSIRSDGLDLDPLYRMFAGDPSKPAPAAAPAKPAATAPATPAVEPAPVVLPLSRLTVDLDIAKLYLGAILAEKWKGHVEVENSLITLKPFELSLNGAPIAFTAIANLGVVGWQYDVNLTANNIDVAPIVDTFRPDYKGKVLGHIAAEAAFKGAGLTGLSFQKNLAGNFNLHSTNLNIDLAGLQDARKRQVAQMVSRPKDGVLSLIGKAFGGLGSVAAPSWYDEISRSPVDTIIFRGDAAAGRVTLKEGLVQSPVLRAQPTGTLTFAPVLDDSKLDFPVGLALRGGVARQMGLSQDTNQYINLPSLLAVNGTLGRKEVKIDKLALGQLLAKTALGGALGGLLNQATDGKAGAVTDKIGGVLNAFGGVGATPAATPATTPAAAAAAVNALTGATGAGNGKAANAVQTGAAAAAAVTTPATPATPRKINALDVFNALSQPKTKSTNAAPATPAPAPKK